MLVLFCNKHVRGQHPRVKSLAKGLLELRRNTNGLMAELDTCDTSKIALAILQKPLPHR